VPLTRIVGRADIILVYVMLARVRKETPLLRCTTMCGVLTASGQLFFSGRFYHDARAQMSTTGTKPRGDTLPGRSAVKVKLPYGAPTAHSCS
jgi:hypothetical protein